VTSDGRIECGYHGWAFEGGGRCTRIPQLAAGKKIPRACDAPAHSVHVADGIVWVADRPGAGALGTPTAIVERAGQFDIITDKSFASGQRASAGDSGTAAFYQL
jgi:phenylpropionate dioxygenase-like ring-hydroxylating dioxygenase large terminal subunit